MGPRRLGAQSVTMTMMTLTRHEVRKWLGSKSLRDFATRWDLHQHFTSEHLVPLFGTQYTFDEANEARDLALKMWDELQGESNA